MASCSNTVSPGEVDDETEKFNRELHWCIKQLELGLQRQSPDSKQAAETFRILKILRSNKAPRAKKRQIMRMALGDYRKKMKDEEKKSISGMRHSRFLYSASSKSYNKSKFLRHSSSKHHDNTELPDSLSSCLQITDGASSSSTQISPPLEPNSDLALRPGACNGDVGEQQGGDLEMPPKLEEDCKDNSLQPIHQPSSEIDKSKMDGKSQRHFHFTPSNNAFCFSFDTPEESCIVQDTSDSVADTDKLCADGVGDGSGNEFKFQKSQNEFSFNFEVDES